MSSEDIKHTCDFMTSKQLFTTTIKLNGTHYLLWVQFFHLFVSSQKKLNHLTLIKGTATYDNWVASDCNMMTWLTV